MIRPTIRDYIMAMLDVDKLPEGFHRDEEALRTLVESRVLVRHIATAAGVSRRAIYKQLHRHDIEPPHGHGFHAATNVGGTYRALLQADPDDIGRATPEGSEEWRDYYSDNSEGQV